METIKKKIYASEIEEGTINVYVTAEKEGYLSDESFDILTVKANVPWMIYGGIIGIGLISTSLMIFRTRAKRALKKPTLKDKIKTEKEEEKPTFQPPPSYPQIMETAPSTPQTTEQPKYCRWCGAKLRLPSRFCEQCGQRIE